MTEDSEAGRRDAPPPGRPVEPGPAEPGEPSAKSPVPAGGEAASTAATPADDAPLGDPPAEVDAESAPSAKGYRARRRRKKAAKRARPRRKAPWWELPALVVLAILIAIVVKSFVVQPFYIPSQSMEKTLHGCPGCHGDRILVNKPIYDFRDPHPGDIVVFDAPKGWDDEPISKPPSNPFVRLVRGFGQLVGFVPPDGQVLVKRVIAVGGQTVKGDARGDVMVSKDGQNGTFRTLKEPFVYVDNGGGGQRAFGPVTVPKGRLWVMGDHRNDSADSRYHCGPNGSDASDDTDCDPRSSTVPVDDVIGKAFVIAWPPSRWRTLGTPSTFESAALAAGPGLPAVASMSAVLPVFFVRRRRRRHPMAK
jgi:signal peptidase I